METLRSMVRPFVTVGVVGAFVGASVWCLVTGTIDYGAFRDGVGTLAVAAFAFWFGSRPPKGQNGNDAPSPTEGPPPAP